MRDQCSKTHDGVQESPSLLDMPLVVADLVLEKLDPIDRLASRKVCRCLKTAIDKFGFHSEIISFYLLQDGFKIFFGRNKTPIRYTVVDKDGLIVAYKELKKQLKGESCLQRAVQDLNIVLKHAFKCKIINWTMENDDIVASFIALLNPEHSFRVKSIILNTFSFNEVLSILSYFDARTLDIIELDNICQIHQFERIAKMDQWRKAKNVNLHCFEFGGELIDHLFHFQCFVINEVSEFSTKIAIKLRDDLMKRSTFQSCIIRFESSTVSPIELARVFKPNYTGKDEFEIEYINKFVVTFETYWSPEYAVCITAKVPPTVSQIRQ